VEWLEQRTKNKGDSLHWVYAEAMGLAEKHAMLQPVLVGLSLHSLRLAVRRPKLTDGQIQAIFYGSAARLFGL